MPKGSNPNSRANLEKGIATRFRKGDTQGKREAAIASNKAQAKARTFAETLRKLLEMELTNSKGEKVSTREAITTALIKKALSGDRAAFAEIRDTVGERPIEQVEQRVEFKDDWRKIADDLGIKPEG